MDLPLYYQRGLPAHSYVDIFSNYFNFNYNLKSIIKNETLAYYIGRIFAFVTKCGIDKEKIRFRQHLGTEMAHYANECWDLECETSFVRIH
jgi:glycyl-tRNA synthetase (class II)